MGLEFSYYHYMKGLLGALMQTIEHELEVTVRVHEVRSEYERQIEERARMAKEVATLKEEAQLQKHQYLSESPRTLSPCARNSRIFALENMLATSSSTLVSMASQLSEAKERERAFNGRGRWSQVRSLAEAKNVMNFLFNLASSSRCQLRDREVNCREKDTEIRDLKEKVVNMVRQLEMQKAEFGRQEKLMKLAKRQSREMNKSSELHLLDSDGHAYDLQPKGSRCSIELLEDMDTSDDDFQLEHSEIYMDDDTEWERTKERKSRPDRKKQSKSDNNLEIASNFEGLNSVNSKDGVCCSCSKSSSCKTMRCECRAARGTCGVSCGCEPTKCSNTEAASSKSLAQPELVEATANISGTTEPEKNHVLASHGAMLLQSALSEKPVNMNDGDAIRKPLCDIGNNLAKSNAPKPNKRKNWRKSVIQLVPATPPTSQVQPNQAPVKSESNVEVEMPLKLPRAMCSANNNPLKERNLDKPNGSVVDKDTSASAPGSPHQQVRTTDGKENQGQ